ncbi:hypothetical protein B0T14DRAFT_500943 [Immersiella caudata]|uniref:Uncharacterized protein n=1 Tax=Immersiella caudata TaxID=314043 RepID=A0AA39WAI2_9PEZI|nr:hypothetical protein B0T14DRAFT_500943 [Immersiella caudata]
MPSSIPYDPSLVLANIITEDALKIVKDIAKEQATVDAAQAHLTALLTTQRSLDMTKAEILNLGYNSEDMKDAIAPLDTALSTMKDEIILAATTFATTKVTAEINIRPKRASIQTVHSQAESPIDYMKTEIKSMPLATDSMNMDVQFLGVEKNDQTGEAHAKDVANFVASSTRIFGFKAQQQVTDAAQSQTARQFTKHNITGTLVISVSCTHKNASVLAPMILNVDKGIRAWNRIFKDPKDRINPNSLSGMKALIEEEIDPDTAKRYSILSGTTYGSSFVGMVHIVNTKDDQVTQNLSAEAKTLQTKINTGLWFEDSSGGFGLNETFGDEIKSLLSTQNVTSHVTLLSMGIIPSIVSNNVAMGVKQWAEFDPKSSMEAIASIQNATAAGQSTMGEAAESARLGKKMISLKANDIKASLSALGDIDAAQNKVLDVNSLMTALEDYVAKVAEAESGVPLNYYLTDITKGMLAELWVAKYYPMENTPQNDDSERKEPNDEDKE